MRRRIVLGAVLGTLGLFWPALARGQTGAAILPGSRNGPTRNVPVNVQGQSIVPVAQVSPLQRIKNLFSGPWGFGAAINLKPAQPPQKKTTIMANKRRQAIREEMEEQRLNQQRR